MTVVDTSKTVFVEKPLEVFSQYYSSFTGMIHFAPHKKEEDHPFSIPMHENFCFVYTLLSTHMSKEVVQGKELLARLLAFQNREGGFPSFLHEFPNGARFRTNLNILSVLYLIYRDYKNIFEKPLLKDIIISIEKAFCFLEKEDINGLIELQRHVLIASYKGTCLAQEKVENLLRISLESSADCSQYLLILALLEQGMYEETIKAAIERLRDLYHPHFQVYIGPLYREFYQEGKVAESLFTAFMGRKCTDDSTCFSLAVLYKLSMQCPNSDGSRDSKHHLYLAQKHTVTDPQKEKGFHLLRMLFSREESLVFPSQLQEFVGEKVENGVLLQFVYPENVPEEEDERYELSFYLTDRPTQKIFNEGLPSTTFHFGDVLSIETESQEKINLCFTLEEGEGEIVGHIQKGNRPSEKKKHHEGLPTAYDWVFTLRTLRRSSQFTISAFIDLPA